MSQSYTKADCRSSSISTIKFDNAAQIISETTLNTNDMYCKAGIGLLNSILQTDEDFGIEALIACLNHWMQYPKQFGTAYTPKALSRFFKNINNQVMTKLTLKDKAPQTGLTLKVGANYGVLIAKKQHKIWMDIIYCSTNQVYSSSLRLQLPVYSNRQNLLKPSKAKQDPKARIELLIGDQPPRLPQRQNTRW